ncbi:MAG: enoyl-CoA hydratase-related protein [Burkholderiaceae bacterium]|nr:enoyl-CoA hydratase-related protein [Burkholderiaceae bacterium]
MRILLLTRSFNSLTQRLFVELRARGHEVSVEYDIADSVTEEAAALFEPDLIVAPFMKRVIPASVWRRYTCFVVHPGIVGDRGPSALDWALAEGETEWGVTVLQAEAEMDAGPVWASRTFALREATKSSLYRHEVTEAATAAVLEAIERYASGRHVPQRIEQGAPGVRGRTRPLMKQDDRRIDWSRDTSADVLRKIRAGDGTPGVLDALFGVPCHLYDAHAAAPLPTRVESGPFEPGQILARRHQAILRATTDGAVWIGHVKRADVEGAFKLPVAIAFPEQVAALPIAGDGHDEIRYEEDGAVGVLHFAFYNGALSTAQCERLLAAYRAALARPTRVLVLAGGPDFFGNGIHLNVIEAAASPADESWRNINAIDDVCEAILTTTDRVTVAALQGNAGAGGAFLAATCDEVWARIGVILNPHYKNMGNLYGSEYWTYTLPRRVKGGDPRAVMSHRLPISAREAQSVGLVDAVIEDDHAGFFDEVLRRAQRLARSTSFAARIDGKRARRARDEAEKPLARYREEELAQMRRNFYGFDPSYHVARSYFVRYTPPSWTPRHLAIHRERQRLAAA